ncbi:ABC transporter permease [Actinomadura gamaensis]|uniref:Transport permease protein n=1 Tax=Actinomadura gamaensis TaxID=1763541 RepID=A0ABV9U3R0_9ACTN
MTTALAHTWYVTQRYGQSVVRQPVWVLSALLQPVIWLVLFGALFRRIVDIPGFGGSYIGFLTPAIVVMTAMFSAGLCGMTVLADLESGVVDRMLVSPIRRGAILGGLLVEQAAVVFVQCTIVLLLGLALGARYEGGPLGALVLLVAAVALGIAIAGLSNAVALTTRRRESVIGVVQLLLMPLTYLSAAFMKLSLVPPWIRDIAHVNPVNWAVTAGREALMGAPDWGRVFLHLGLTVAFAVLATLLGNAAFGAYRRSV